MTIAQSFHSRRRLLGLLGGAACLGAGPASAAVALRLGRLKAFTQNAVILFQGDSITDGGRWPGNDLNHTMGQAYDYLISAEVGLAYPERNLTFLNRGVSGNTTPKLAARWQADTIDLKPDFLSILAGVNDTFYSDGESVETFETTYDRLILDTRAALPNVKIVLGEPFLMPAGHYEAGYAGHAAALGLRQAAVARLAERHGLPLVRYQAAFTAAMAKAPAVYWSWDGVHPTYAGHALMAREWLKTVDKAWR